MCALVTNDYNGVMIATPPSVEINDYNRHDCAALAAISLCFSYLSLLLFVRFSFTFSRERKNQRKRVGILERECKNPHPSHYLNAFKPQ